jgi:putative tryptophan/tyrosine transport system substrate-binding protein
MSMHRVQRRDLLIAAGALVAAKLAVAALPTDKPYRIGVFHVGDHIPPSLQTLRNHLRTIGYEEGRNIQLHFRNLPGEETAERTAREFVQLRVDLIVAIGDPAARAAKAATSEIPIVMIHVTDPVAHGFVNSLARPGGNVTGFVFFAVSPAKHVELFKEMILGLRLILVLIDPNDPATPAQLTELRRAASIMKLKLMEREATDQAGLEQVFGSIKPGDIDGVVSASNSLHIKFTTPLITLASAKRAPLASYRKEAVEEGALFSYAPDVAAIERRAAAVVDKILKGAKPSDIPVDEPSKFELVINLRTAVALDLTIPPSLLVRADEVIQ